MSFLTGTQVECIYAMPFKATAVTAAATTVMSATATQGPCYLPQGFFMQQSGGGIGKSLMLQGGGIWSVGTTADTMTFSFGLDTTAGTLGTTMGATGAITPVASTSGTFMFELLFTLTAEGSAGTGECIGNINIATISTAGAQTTTLEAFGTTNSTNTVMIGNPNSGVSSIATASAFYVEAFAAWSATTGTPSLQLTNFYVFGLN